MRTGRVVSSSLGVVVAVIAGLSACGRSVEPPADLVNAGLPPTVAARVAGQDFSVAVVEDVARAESVPLSLGRHRVVEDALFGAEAEQRLAASGRVVAARRSNDARALLEALWRDVKVAGPATDAERKMIDERFWPVLDRPPMAQTRHVLVATDKGGGDKKTESPPELSRVAAQLVEATAGATSGDDFERRARTVKAPSGLKIVIEPLPPVAADGRYMVEKDGTWRPGGFLDKHFSEAAHAIPNENAISPSVSTDFGQHIIYLEKLYPAKSAPAAERAALIEGELALIRARERLQTILKDQAAQRPVRVPRTAEALTAGVRLVDEQAPGTEPPEQADDEP